jgi:hypothetical protein
VRRGNDDHLDDVDHRFVDDHQHNHSIDHEFNDLDHAITLRSDDVHTAFDDHDRGCVGCEGAAGTDYPGDGRP